MTKILQSGQGSCPLEFSFLFRASQEVMELGAWDDVRTRVLRTVHHFNRQGDENDYLAVAFPELCRRAGHLASGFSIEIFGSEGALMQLIKNENIQTLKRRGMIEDREIQPVFIESGSHGRAFVRDRSAEKGSISSIKRSQRRAKAAGVTFQKEITPGRRGKHGSVLHLRIGKSVVNVRSVLGIVSAGPIAVSTYGFSASTAPSYLPVAT